MSRPLQNRVRPTGEIVAVQNRGTLLGNRGGRIHSNDQEIVRKWASKQWICCVLEFKNRQRDVMGQFYTELFFLDEATAFAAGHRPCFECRRGAAVKFATHWAELRGRTERAKVKEMDDILHAERLGAHESLPFESLPVGVMFNRDGATYLKTERGALAWSFAGYSAPVEISGQVEAVTPASIRGVLGAGYAPMLHPSAISA